MVGGVADPVHVPVAECGGDQRQQLGGQLHRAGGAFARPQPHQHRQAHRCGAQRQPDHDPGDHPPVPPGDLLAALGGAVDRIGRAARWFPWWKLLFRAALLRTTRARFRACGSPVIYAALVTGWAWMSVVAGEADHEGLASFGRHERRPRGLARPGWSQAGSLRTWCTSTLPGSPHSSHRRVRSRWISSLRGWGAGWGMRSSEDRVLVAHQGDPAEPGYQIRLAVAVDPGLEARPQPVPGLDLGLVLGGHLRHGGLVLRGEGLQHRRQGVPAQVAQAPDVGGEQVVADDAPVFGPVGRRRCRSRPGSAGPAGARVCRGAGRGHIWP